MILLNGKLVADATAAISPLGEGFQFGAGVFTTIRVSGKGAEFLSEHAARLTRDALALGLQPVSELAVLHERCAACIAANGIENGGLKVMWFADVDGRTSEIISQRVHHYGPEAKARGFRLMTMRCGSREGRKLSLHKTLNYLEHVHAKRRAVEAGFDEALWVDERGRVLEGATTNIFAVFRDAVITPDVRSGLLPGVARSVVLQLGAARPVRAEELTRERLAEAEEVFITNALMGVMPVRGIDEHAYPLARTSVATELAARWDEAAMRSMP